MDRKFALGIILIMIQLLSSCSKHQQYDAEEDFEFRIIDSGRSVEIVGYKGNNDSPKTVIRIPPRIQNLPVTVIGEDAFLLKLIDRESDTLDLVLPNGITHIGKAAFGGNYLTSVIIPNSVTYIGDYAFGNNAFTNITIPDSVTYLGESSFWSNQIIEVSIPNSLTHIENSTFSENEIENLIIPDSVIYIGNGAFMDNKLIKVIIPSSVTHIETVAFRGNQITSITIGSNVDIYKPEAPGESELFDAFMSDIRNLLNDQEFYYYTFENDFDFFYRNNGKKGGIYTFRNNRWLFSGNSE
jgi:hypothetical protein